MNCGLVISVSLLLLHSEHVWSLACKFGREELNVQGLATTQLGQYIDLEHPLNCSGYIVKWHLCYYTSNVRDSTDHQVYLRVYRNESSEELVRVHQMMVEYELDSSGPDTLVCTNKSLDAESYVRVEAGDYLAVYLPTLSPQLIVVGYSSPQLMLYRDNRRFPDPFTRENVPFSRLNGIAGGLLHLNADVVPQSELGPISSSIIPHVSTTASISSSTWSKIMTTTPPANPRPPSGTDTSSDDSEAGTSTWKIAVVVTFATILLALFLATVVVAIVVYRRWRVKQMKRTLLEIRPSHLSIDNATYDLPMFADDYRLFKSSKKSKGSGAHKGTPSRSKREASTVSENLYESPYDEGIAEVFSIYAALAPSSEEFRSSVKKVVTTLSKIKPAPYQTPATHEELVYEQISGQRVPALSAKHIKIIGQIGSGQFANVEKGVWSRASGMIEVAVKTLHPDASSTDKLKFLQEGAISSQFRHPNVIFLHGIITDKSKVSLVMEFMSKGDLKGCLMEIQTEQQTECKDIPSLLLSYSTQVALGMLYLSDKGFIHRDLAARNILVSDKDVCKIADFGMSRDLADAEYYISEGGTIPIRWTAPEAVYYRKYSTASDVWSYGCVLYEIWSLGHKPFESCSNTQVLKEISIGFRLPPPPGCPLRAYDTMIKCWHPQHSKRPGFDELLRLFLDNEKSVLNIPTEDAATHEKATCLGAELQAGHMMYRNLQALYIPADVSISDRPQCDGANLIKYTSDRRRDGDYEDIDEEDYPTYLNIGSGHLKTPSKPDNGRYKNTESEDRPGTVRDTIYDSIIEERLSTENKSGGGQREGYYNVIVKPSPTENDEFSCGQTNSTTPSVSEKSPSPPPPPPGPKPVPARLERESSTASLHDMADSENYEVMSVFTSNNDEVAV